MRNDVKDLIAEIEGDDSSARENAILNLMYRMEESTRHIVKNDVVDDEHLSQDEQIELIDALIELAESLKPEYAGLLWVISKANPIITVDPVQNFVLKHAEAMPISMLHQSLVALQNSFRVPEGSRDYELIQEKFRYEQLKVKLRPLQSQLGSLCNVLQDTLSNIDTFCTQ